jgi:CheY-like chemotaxis protein
MANGSAIQILLADDNPLVRQALRSALRAYPNINVVGEANDGEEALVRVEQLRPTIVVMDINMRRMDGITATRLIKARYPEISVVGLSARTERLSDRCDAESWSFRGNHEGECGGRLVWGDTKGSGSRSTGSHYGGDACLQAGSRRIASRRINEQDQSTAESGTSEEGLP